MSAQIREPQSLFSQSVAKPLPDLLRPSRLSEVVGQDHLLAEDAPLGRMIKGRRLASLVLWGPPGCGKTTIARLLAQETALHFESVSAVSSGVGDLRRLFEDAGGRRNAGVGTLVFVDEIHRFNRAQQDVLLPYVEDGTVTLVGATTENPSFELVGALLSRCQVMALKRLDDDALEALLKRAEDKENRRLPLTDESRRGIKAMADGDGRYLLVMAQELFSLPQDEKLSPKQIATFLQKRATLYDKAQDSHYNLISALHKSLRGSDCDAALYWLARMLRGGENPRYILRRLTRFASEDIGLADPQALPMALAAWQAYERIGSPEGDLAVAELVIYLATAPKSNATYLAYKACMRAAEDNGSLAPPKHILNAPTKLMKEIGYGEGYAYDHDSPEAFSGQNYFPETMPRHAFYEPVERGFEREIRKRLAYWNQLRTRKSK